MDSERNFPIDNSPIPGEPKNLSDLRKVFDVLQAKPDKTQQELDLGEEVRRTISEAEGDLDLNPTLSSQTGEKVYKLIDANKNLIEQ